VIDLRSASINESLPSTLRTTFALLLAGQTEKEMAYELHRSPNTIHDHVKRIYSHFGVTSRPQLMARFIDVDKVLSQLPHIDGNGPFTPDEA
jgi:DNA-binding NarL/FixJ family response regulator